MADGRILMAGGHWDPPDTPNALAPFDLNRFDPITTPNPTWQPRLIMHRRRWYPTCTTLPDGKILITYGYARKVDQQPFQSVPEHEVFTDSASPPLPPNQATQVLTQFANSWDFEVYPYVFVMPDGSVLFAGPLQKAPKNWSNPRRLIRIDPSDPSTWIWETGNGRPFPSTFSNNEGGSVCMFDAVAGKILTAGGVNLPPLFGTHNKCAIYQHSTGAWETAQDMNFARLNHNLVCLPDLSVLAVGGNLNGNHYIDPPGNTDPQPRMIAEIFKPWLGTNGQWESTGVSMTDPRYYHSAALLLQDGRVLSCGGETDTPGAPPYNPPYTQNSAQVFSPPYLDDDSLRPIITTCPESISYGSQFTVIVNPQGTTISHVTLTRLGACTHGFDQDQRGMSLFFGKSLDQSTLTVTAPANGNIAPPGYYFLWVLTNARKPCVLAKIVRIGS